MNLGLAAILGVFAASAAHAEPASVDAYMGQAQVKADARIA